MKNVLHVKTVLATLSLCVTGVCAAEPWTRGYVVEWNEHAAYFGGTGLLTEPGTDCPKGTEPELDLKKVLVKDFRSPEDVAIVLDLEVVDKPESLFEAMTKRGDNGENIYRNPKATADVGMLEVEGDIALGFDLDGDPETGFAGPNGERGIDNNFYRAWGCWESFRGPERQSAGGLYHNDEMLNGKFTLLFLFSGKQDPMNDDDVSFGIYTSQDTVVKDAFGKAASEYSFKIDSDNTFANVLKAKIEDGVLTLSERPNIRMRESSFLATLTLYEAQGRFEFSEDGSLFGMLGGYKPIQEAISTWTIAGPNVELVSHVNLSAAYYSLERHADSRPDPETGLNTAISTAWRFWAVPAFIIKPDGSDVADEARWFGEPRSREL